MKKLVLIDSYDSFTYNLVHFLEDLGAKVVVFENDRVNWEALERADGIVLSPGPGLPEESGDLMKVVAQFIDHKPMLGVCLGMQAMGIHQGKTLNNLQQVFHGVSDVITVLEQDPMYSGLSDKEEVGRYHSWVVNEVPEGFIPTGEDADGNLMSFRHPTRAVWGVQYHPESILTPNGKQILKNWLDLLQ